MDIFAQIVLIIFIIIRLVMPLGLLSFIIAGMWKTFIKAGKSGWGSLIPFYNIYIILEISDNPGWWVVFYLIPIVNIVFSFKVSAELANKFGKSDGFGIGLALLPFIFYPILGFGRAEYIRDGI